MEELYRHIGVSMNYKGEDMNPTANVGIFL